MIHEGLADEVVADARALLATFVAGSWQELYVASGGSEILIARADGRLNPMRRAQADPCVADSPASRRETAHRIVTAPHVATLVLLSPLGGNIAAGAAVATIRVLDQESTVAAPISGKVVRHESVPGALIEYGAPLLVIEEAGS